MDANKLEYFRNLIQHEMAGLTINQAKTKKGLVVQAEHLPDEVDRASSQSERNFELRIREREQKLITKMEEAIFRIDDGTYGICDHCGEGISENRLIARPVSTLCFDCKTEQEQMEKRRGMARGPAIRTYIKEPPMGLS